MEQATAKAEIEAGIKAAGTDPSKSDLTPYLQGVAHRNSAFSQLKFSTIPWFNFANHPYHGNGSEAASSSSSS